MICCPHRDAAGGVREHVGVGHAGRVASAPTQRGPPAPGKGIYSLTNAYPTIHTYFLNDDWISLLPMPPH
jgi:hypothetical protein